MNKLYYTTRCNGSNGEEIDSYYITEKEAKQAIKDSYEWLNDDVEFSEAFKAKMTFDYKYVRIINYKRNKYSFVALLNALRQLPKYNNLPKEVTIT